MCENRHVHEMLSIGSPHPPAPHPPTPPATPTPHPPTPHPTPPPTTRSEVRLWPVPQNLRGLLRHEAVGGGAGLARHTASTSTDPNGENPGAIRGKTQKKTQKDTQKTQGEPTKKGRRPQGETKGNPPKVQRRPKTTKGVNFVGY